MGLMLGDALGMAFEGQDRAVIRKFSQERWGHELVQDFVPAVPMGTFVPAGEPGKYRPAREVRDSNFVGTGPTSNPHLLAQCVRVGMYTDDTNACLGLASSIVEFGRADAVHAARSIAELFRDNEAYRGCPPTAKAVMRATLDGVNVDDVGVPPHFPFEGGSFANGGAMRISPLAIAYRNADFAVLRRGVEAAIRASHRHPEAVDFAVVQAAAVKYALQVSPEEFCSVTLLHDLAELCETEAMRGVVAAVSTALRGFAEGDEELKILESILEKVKRPGSGLGFQIASVHMAPCVLWAVCKYHSDPLRAVQAAIDLGGDTDTTASMVGAIVGALHGESAWGAKLPAALENGPHGRDYSLGLAEKLLALDVVT